MTSEEAKQMLIEQMVDDAKLEAARTLREMEEETKNEADKKKPEVLSPLLSSVVLLNTSQRSQSLLWLSLVMR